MDDQQPASGQDFNDWMVPGRQNVQLIYILYLVNFLVPFAVIVGVVFAYLGRGKSEGWLDSHYTYLIRTFWIGFLYIAVSLLLFFVVIGLFLMIATVIWFVIRVVKGLQALGAGASGGQGRYMDVLTGDENRE